MDMKFFADGLLSCPIPESEQGMGRGWKVVSLPPHLEKEASTDQLMGVGVGDGVASFMALG